MQPNTNVFESIFFAALNIPEPEARANYLDEACGQDDELRQRIAQMLVMQSKVGSFMERPPADFDGTLELERKILDAGLSAGFGPGQAVVIGSGNHSVLKSLGKTLNDIPRVILRDAKDPNGDPIVRPRSKELPADHVDSRYQLVGEIARGGMGAIIKGRDIDLGRDLVIKVLLDSHKNKPEVVQRFIEEAQIGGQLQHPGIVPVYELGQFGDQRPFFSMKLVKGETLSELLTARKHPTADRAKYLGIFEQICQTMAYAHSRGVIHRDLKPANVMVGAFGEVQVMDWGLAKVLSTGGIADEKRSLEKLTEVSIIRTLRSVGSDTPGTLGSQTQMGSVMGTPAYMSPEQALGEVDRLDECADVFGLGAILCEILTGKPPYVAANGEQVFRMASRGKLDDCYTRLAASEVDAELMQIVRDSLELEPDDRLRDAGQLAKRVSDYLQSVDQRLRQSELDRHQAVTRSEEASKRHRVMLALAASVLVTLGVASGGWIWVQQKNAQIAQAAMRQEQKENTEQARLASQIIEELSTARALRGDPNSDTQVDFNTLTTAHEAAKRAEALLANGEVDEQLKRDIETLLVSLDNQLRDQRLIIDLEYAWSLEMEKLAHKQLADTFLFTQSRQTALAQAQPSPLDKVDSPAILDIEPNNPVIPEAASLYQQAFLKWGIDPVTTSTVEAAHRIQSLPKDRRSSVLVSLHRWQESVNLNTLSTWNEANWQLIKPNVDQMYSKLGSKFTLEEDGSIFVSGDYPGMSPDFDRRAFDDPNNRVLNKNGEFPGVDIYTFSILMQGRPITALKLEFIPDKRLNGGAGRSPRGIFLLSEFGATVGNLSDGEKPRSVTIRNAYLERPDSGTNPITQFSNVWDGDDATSWQPQPAFQATIIFELSPIFLESKSSELQLRIVSGGMRVPAGALGHFRLWATSYMPFEALSSWISAIIDQSDDDPRQRDLLADIAKSDFKSLMDPTATNEIEKLPKAFNLQLTQTLLTLKDEADLVDWNKRVSWAALRPTKMESNPAISLQLESDDSIFVGENANSDSPGTVTYDILAPIENRSLKAIRLETIPDDRLPVSRAGYRGDGAFYLNHIEIEILNSESLDVLSTPRIVTAMTDANERSNGPLSQNVSHLIDNDPSTGWAPNPSNKPNAAVFWFDDMKLESGAKLLRIRIKQPMVSRLGKFRLSVTYDESKPFDPRSAASSLLLRLQQQQPADYWNNFALAQCLAQQKPPLRDEALRYATAAIALRPQTAAAHAGIVRLLPPSKISRHDPLRKLAIYHAKRADELDPTMRVASELGTMHYDLGSRLFQTEPDEAIVEFRAAIDVNPTTRNCLALASALIKRNKLDEAVSEFRSIISRTPNRAGPRLGLAEILWRQEQLESAFEEIRQAISIAPKDADAHKIFGYHLDANGRPEEAIVEYQAATDLLPKESPRLMDLNQLLGRALVNQGNAQGAIDASKRAIEGEGPYSLTRLGLSNAELALGYSLIMQGKRMEAIEAFRRAIKVYPEEESICHRRIITAMSDEGILEGEIPFYEQKSKVESRSVSSRILLSYAYNRVGRLEEAITIAHEAVDLDPDSAEAHYHLSDLLSTSPNESLRNPTEALAHAIRACELTPNSTRRLDILAVAQYRTGEWQASLDTYQRYMNTQGGGTAVNWYFVAMAHWQLGDKLEARKWYEKAVAWGSVHYPQSKLLERFGTEAAMLLKP